MRKKIFAIASMVSVLTANGILKTLFADEQRSGSPSAAPVVLDFYAVRADGQPIRDLKAEEVALRVDGRPRKIVSLRHVAIADVPAGDATRTAPPPPPFGTNVHDADTRTLVLVLDDDSFRPGREQPLRVAVAEFLNELSAADRVALVTVPYGGLKVDFTTDRDRINQALSKIVGQSPANQTGSELACRTRRSLESVAGMLESDLAGGQGPTTVIFFSSGLAGPRRDAEITRAPGPCELTSEDFRKVGTAASLARAHFYVVMPDPIMARPSSAVENIAGRGFTGSDNPYEGLEHLAGVTGGKMFDLMASGRNMLERVTRETSGYYLVEFEGDPVDRAGSRHPVDVRVSRPDVSVRSRPEMTIARPGVSRTASKAKTPRDMLRETTVFRDLPLRGIGYVSQDPGESRLKVVSLIEPLDLSSPLVSAAVGLIDSKGRLAFQWTATAEELKSIPVTAGLSVAPGPYRLRVAAMDAAGRRGSADYDLAAELTSVGGLKVSGLVLGLSRGGFRPRLQFGAEPVALGYLELYGKPSGDVSVTFEVSGSVNGPTMLRVPGVVAGTADEERRVVTAALPIGGLQPGDYVVRAVVEVAGQPSARVLRTLRKGK